MSGLTIGSLTLSPAFSATTTAYAAVTTNKTNVVKATTDDEGATISITLTNANNTDKAVSNGGTVTWADGENVIKITVTKGDEATTYTVVVSKS